MILQFRNIAHHLNRVTNSLGGWGTDFDHNVVNMQTIHKCLCCFSKIIVVFWVSGLCANSSDLQAQEQKKLRLIAQYEEIQYYDIKAGGVGSVLNEFSLKTDSEIFYSTEIVHNIHSPGVYGAYTEQEALGKILENTGLQFERTAEKIYLIHAVFSKNLSSGKKKRVIKPPKIEKIYSKENWDIEELIVTANKRNQSIQSLPLSIAALNHTELQQRELVSMVDYLSTIPGVNQVDRGVGRNSIIIRGVSADPAFEDATVGVYFDETPLTGRAYFGSVDLKLVDMERVEILRGPQGTLYGAGALAGAVRNIPVDPNLVDIEGDITIGYSKMGSYGHSGNEITGVINIPLIQDEMAIRISAYQFENSGYIKNIAGQDANTLALAQKYGRPDLAIVEEDIGSSDYYGARARFLWEPTDQFSMSVNYIWQELMQKGLPDVESEKGRFKQARLQLLEPIGGGEKLVDDFDLGSVVLKYNTQWGEILSATSVYKEYALRNTELSRVIGEPTAQSPQREANVFIEEIRFTSDLDGPLQVLAGVYYEDNKWSSDVLAISVNEADVMPNNIRVLLDSKSNTIIEQAAVFGDITFEFNDKITFTVGGRYFDYTRTDSSKSQGELVNNDGVLEPKPVKRTESGVNTKANLSYSYDNGALVYIQYSEGFRLGGPQLPIPVDTCDQNPKDGLIDDLNIPIDTDGYNSDQLNNIEIGAKLSGEGNRWIINSAFYYNDWTDLQVKAESPACGVQVIVNAGSARTQGVDIESTLFIKPQFRINAGLSYVDAELTKDVDFLNASKGNRLAGSPQYSLNLAAQYDFEIMSADAFFRMDYTRIGRFYGNIQEAGLSLGNYNLINVKAGMSFKNISVGFYINNLANTYRLIWNDESLKLKYPLRPRVIGLEFQYNF